ncbi:MAG: CopG family ribbon-helix-helix protein [Clostridia bacterium]
MERKEISITLPDDILTDVDKISRALKVSRSNMIESMIKIYLAERRRIENKKKLGIGYAEMAEINLSIAEECFDSDQATQDAYEDYLMGCE